MGKNWLSLSTILSSGAERKDERIRRGKRPRHGEGEGGGGGGGGEAEKKLRGERREREKWNKAKEEGERTTGRS